MEHTTHVHIHYGSKKGEESKSRRDYMGTKKRTTKKKTAKKMSYK